MSPQAGLAIGVVVIGLATGLLVVSIDAELNAIHARLDQHQRVLEAVALLLDLSQAPPGP